MEYVPIFLEWLDVTQDLSSEEKGRLIDAVVTYAAGEDYTPLLIGQEKIAFRFLKGQVDRNKAISEKRSKAGSNKQEQTQTIISKTEQTGTNENNPDQDTANMLKEKDKDKEKEKEKEKNKEQQREQQEKFDRFWAVYPRHEAKQNALKAFQKINPDADLLKTICAAVERWKHSEQWTNDGGQFIPHPATWLNQRRWEDEIPSPAPAHQVKRVQEQEYEQRENHENGITDVPDWIKKYQEELSS